jgi:hypothetical protein
MRGLRDVPHTADQPQGTWGSGFGQDQPSSGVSDRSASHFDAFASELFHHQPRALLRANPCKPLAWLIRRTIGERRGHRSERHIGMLNIWTPSDDDHGQAGCRSASAD